MKRMYRVILADDEKWSVFGLIHLIRWEDFGCEIVGMAENGPEALKMCMEMHPDLLISDIRMPGMDGLDLARILAIDMPETTTILMTGYGDLNYAQRAVRLGVFDYLLKQITADDLTACIKRFVEHARGRSRTSLSGLYFSLFDESNDRSVQECMDSLCISMPKGSVRAVTCVFDSIVALQAVRVDEENSAVLFHTGANTVTCFLYEQTGAENLRTICSDVLQRDVRYIGASPDGRPENGFYELYRQSYVAAMSAQFWDIKEPYIYCDSGAEAFNELLETMRSQLKEGICDPEWAMNRLFHALEGMPVDLCERTINQAIALLGAFQIGHFENQPYADAEQYAAAGGKAKEMFDDLQSALRDEENLLVSQDLIPRVMQYIEENYRRDIRITELAEHFYMNSSYLSTLIRKRTGKTFSAIVTEKRMAYACELLRGTRLSVQEVSARAGYHEYSHFNRLFKTTVGKTPAQYRTENKSLNQ